MEDVYSYGIILWEMRFANWFVEFSVKDSLLFLLSNKFCNCTGDPKEIIPNIFANDSTNKIILLDRHLEIIKFFL